MKAYIVSDISVVDETAFERYKAISAESVALHGGEFVARGGEINVLEGDWLPKRISIIEFPDVETANSWITSSDYAPAKSIRHSSAMSNIIMVTGVSARPSGSDDR